MRKTFSLNCYIGKMKSRKNIKKNLIIVLFFVILYEEKMFDLRMSLKSSRLFLQWKLEIYRKTLEKAKILLMKSFFDKTESSKLLTTRTKNSS